MTNTNSMKLTTLDQLKDKHIGSLDSVDRNQYEFDLKVEVLGDIIKSVRKERHLTQEQLGKLVGVQKAQISKLENNTKNVTIETILKVFNALRTNVSFNIELLPI